MENLPLYLRILPSALVFMGLYIAVILSYKILGWMSDRAFDLSKRIRFQMIGFICAFSTWWLLLDLPPFNYQMGMVTFTRSLFIFFFILLILDLMAVVLFDVYLPAEKVKVPHIVVNFVRILYLVGLVLFILKVIFNFDIKPFLTGSAILTAIIGLALQDTMGNFFSGLALHVSRPFNIGHWIKMGELEGVVTKIDWRAATIKTRSMDYITIPNSLLAKTDLTNFSTPTQLHALYIDVGVRYGYPPNKIKSILTETAMKTEGISTEIPPSVLLIRYNDFSIDYSLKVFIEDYTNAPFIKSRVMERIWYTFSRNNIEIPFPIRDVYIKESLNENLEKEDLATLLSRIDFIQGLSYEEVMDVTRKVKQVVYAQGERVIRQGDTGNTLFIIKSGTVEVSSKNEKGEVFLVKQLDAGNLFGEISVFTGEPRTATVRAVTDVELLVLAKEDFDIILRKYPHMAEHISVKIAARQKHSFEQMELTKNTICPTDAETTAQKQVESLSSQLLQRIKEFFSIW